MSKTVYVYNGYADLHLQFNGQWFDFPAHKITKVEDYFVRHPDEWKRNHPSDPDLTANLERTYAAKEFVDNLFTRHGQNLIADRVVWIGERDPTPKEMAAANEFGRIRKMKQVEEALAERRSALAKGGKPELDPTIVEWMIEYDMHDDTYNRPVPVDASTVMAEAFQKAMEVIAAQQQQQPAGARK